MRIAFSGPDVLAYSDRKANRTKMMVSSLVSEEGGLEWRGRKKTGDRSSEEEVRVPSSCWDTGAGVALWNSSQCFLMRDGLSSQTLGNI